MVDNEGYFTVYYNPFPYLLCFLNLLFSSFSSFTFFFSPYLLIFYLTPSLPFIFLDLFFYFLSSFPAVLFLTELLISFSRFPLLLFISFFIPNSPVRPLLPPPPKTLPTLHLLPLLTSFLPLFNLFSSSRVVHILLIRQFLQPSTLPSLLLPLSNLHNSCLVLVLHINGWGARK